MMGHPLFAVDYVRDRDGDIHALDLNVCPGVPREVINAVGRETLRESLKRYMT